MAAFFENPMFREAMEQVHDAISEVWRGTPSGEQGRETREELHRLYIAAVTLDKAFKESIQDGEDAVKTIRRLTERRNSTEGEVYHA